MKRSHLKRRTPLRRKTRLRTRRKSAYKRRPRDTPYMMWIKRQPCCARAFSHLSRCFGRIEADHAGGGRAKGHKAPDRTCIPMCQRHHGQRDAFKGPFRDWDHDRMRRWLDHQITLHQAEYQLQGERHARTERAE